MCGIGSIAPLLQPNTRVGQCTATGFTLPAQPRAQDNMHGSRGGRKHQPSLQVACRQHHSLLLSLSLPGTLVPDSYRRHHEEVDSFNRHIWLNLCDEHMTAGRINQVSY